MRAFSSSISVVVEELADDELLPPPPPPPPAWRLEDAEDVVEPDEEDAFPEDVPPDVAFVVDAVVFAGVDVVVPLVPSPTVRVEVVDCICMVRDVQFKD